MGLKRVDATNKELMVDGKDVPNRYFNQILGCRPSIVQNTLIGKEKPICTNIKQKP